MAGDWAAARREQDRLTRLFRIVDAADPATSGRHPGRRRVQDRPGAARRHRRQRGVAAAAALDAAETGRVRTQLELAGLL
ncbi:hypothetical protein [Micromonospora sp. b486]|uniref:hypothetical protein n=1 Tax=Micromonospora sp. b486 TaxID=3053986 RepID=UPI00259C8701|nr:hypothetical protein [Micromonospora sp. b486]MDM4777794.1 hypothetical protein [Micromonospora sp. b486]